MMQDQIRDDAGADRDQKEVAIVAAYPVIAAPRPAQVRATPVIDNVGPTTVLDRHIAAPAIPAFVATAVIHAVAITITVAIMAIGVGVTATIPMAPIIVVMVVAPVVAAIIPAVIAVVIAVVIAAIIVTVPMIVLALIRALVTLPYRLGHNGCAR